MSVLIKGMDMPKNCTDCTLRIGNWCVPLQRDTRAWKRPDRSKYCPLVEVPTPHGRLLDEDVILPKRYKKKGIIYIGNFVEIEAVIEAEE